MNRISRFLLKAARHLYFRKRHLPAYPSSTVEWNADAAPSLLGKLIASDKPFMIARFGSIELEALCRYLLQGKGFSPLSYIKGNCPLPQWDKAAIAPLCCNAGFFPQEMDAAEQFCQLMLDCIPQLDILGSWLKYESLIDHLHQAQKVHLANLEPFDDSGKPWSQHLAGRKVLVVHPFTESITRQYQEKRELLFANPLVLPQFELKTIKAVQSMGGIAPEGMSTWFDALQHMQDQIDASDYDTCLLGCGAYGFPLAAHIKKQGKQAIHMGGALQLLFGIKGKRWVEQYGREGSNPYLKLFNEHWIYPDESERPAAASKVEDGCYW